ncbi:hypothetical protein B0H17DRAFT_1148899 [Mycena rosella]|uniref:Uncharacterized protein n=1 Tax=Mycena rosella TaxID=1033263 RepID=A0AAD7FW37_MYCRO|nr:hypothetical protein B0H17DRAFT_1148899 [Mycena rosella]
MHICSHSKELSPYKLWTLHAHTHLFSKAETMILQTWAETMTDFIIQLCFCYQNLVHIPTVLEGQNYDPTNYGLGAPSATPRHCVQDPDSRSPASLNLATVQLGHVRHMWLCLARQFHMARQTSTHLGWIWPPLVCRWQGLARSPPFPVHLLLLNVEGRRDRKTCWAPQGSLRPNLEEDQL